MPSVTGDVLRFGHYPTPLRKIEGLTDAAHDLWIKDDGQSATVYGGNKVRKLERLLTVAQRRGARRLLTVGAAGSHHVLATTVFGRRVGLPTHAVLTPQPWTPHAEATLRAGLNTGLSAAPAASAIDAVLQLRRQRRPGDFVIGPGGFGVEGTWAYRLAVDELQRQLRDAGVSRVDAILVAAGSGSTAAGLLAGVLETGIAARVIAIQVAPHPLLRLSIIGQALCALRRYSRPAPATTALRALTLESGFIGAGYGHPAAGAEAASELARSFGLALEPTYTAKAFAAALSRARGEDATALKRRRSPRPAPADHCDVPRKLGLHRRQTYLYWHTVSSAPLTPLLAGAPEALPQELAQLLAKPYL